MALRFYAIWCLLITVQVFGQTDEQTTNSIVEKYLENAETSADYTQLSEDIAAFISNPLALNTASAEEILACPFLTQKQALAIIQHRMRFGEFSNLAELQVAGFSPEEIKRVRQFISLESKPSVILRKQIEALTKGQFQAVISHKIKTPSVVPDSSAGPGSYQNIRIRYALANHYSFGLTADRDAGEVIWNKGPDFYSAHAAVENIGHFKKLIVGDYVMGFGQGLVMGSGIGMGKSAMVLQTKRNFNGIKPYRGINEYLFLRGTSVTLSFGKVDFTMAAAQNKVDARLLDTIGYYNSGYDLDGLHRTPAEVRNKWNSHRKMAGGWMKINNRSGYWGFGKVTFSYLGKLTQNDLYKQFNTTGNNQSFIHLYQANTLGRYHLFSEWALSIENLTRSAVAGLMTTVGSRIEVSLLFRQYDPGFVSPFSTAFGNSSQNETGFYSGLRVTLNPKLILATYADFWSAPWLNYRIWSPSKSSDFFTQAEYKPNRKTFAYLRFRNITKPFPQNQSEPVKTIAEQQILNFRFHINTDITRELNLQMRVESSHSTANTIQDQASLFFAQISSSRKIKLTMRYTLFHIPWYYNRLYAFENQLPYDFSTVAFYGSGYEYFILARKKLNRNWTAGMRFSNSKVLQPASSLPVVKSSVYFQLIYTR